MNYVEYKISCRLKNPLSMYSNCVRSARSPWADTYYRITRYIYIYILNKGSVSILLFWTLKWWRKHATFRAEYSGTFYFTCRSLRNAVGNFLWKTYLWINFWDWFEFLQALYRKTRKKREIWIKSFKLAHAAVDAKLHQVIQISGFSFFGMRNLCVIFQTDRW